MSIEVLMPKHGLNMSDGHVVEIFKNVGDKVSVGDVLFVFETSKAVVDFESRHEGVVSEVLVEVGDDVPVGDTVLIISASGEATVTEQAVVETKVAAVEESLSADAPSESVKTDEDRYVPATPWVKHLAKEEQVDLKALTGTGTNNRITEEDVRAYSASSPVKAQVQKQTKAPLMAGAHFAEIEVPLSRIKKITGDRLAQSFQEVPHIYFSASVRMDAVRDLRTSLLVENNEKYSYSDMLLAACIKALKKYPGVNAHYKNAKLYHEQNINIGFAVATERGLVVPVLHEAQRLSFTEMAKRRKDLVARALQGKLMPEEMESGTFTLTNMGSYDIDMFDPIINQPEVAILSTGTMKDTVVVEDGAIRIAPVMQLRLAGNHRALDGVDCAEFLSFIKKSLEQGDPFWS